MCYLKYESIKENLLTMGKQCFKEYTVIRFYFSGICCFIYNVFFDKFSKANPFFPVVDVYTNIIILIMRNMGYFSINENDPEKE